MPHTLTQRGRECFFPLPFTGEGQGEGTASSLWPSQGWGPGMTLSTGKWCGLRLAGPHPSPPPAGEGKNHPHPCPLPQVGGGVHTGDGQAGSVGCIGLSTNLSRPQRGRESFFPLPFTGEGQGEGTPSTSPPLFRPLWSSPLPPLGEGRDGGRAWQVVWATPGWPPP